MKIFFSILLNGSILYIIQFLLNTPEYPNSVIVSWWMYGWQAYLIWWIILWLLNITIKPVLKILWIPISIFFSSLVTLVINVILLWLLDKIINNILVMENISYEINWTLNFIIAVAIFTFLNMLYSILFSKN